jgi:hypothetical protein
MLLHSIPLLFLVRCNCSVMTSYMCICSSGMVDLKELSLVNGKAAWMAYLVMALLSIFIFIRTKLENLSFGALSMFF